MSYDRESYLAELAAATPLPPDVRREVLEELATHLDDEVAELIESGYQREAALHEAMRRLGPPEELGPALADARQGRRRLLAAVGGGAWAALRAGIYTMLVGWILIVLATIVVAILVHAAAARFGSDLWLSTSAGWNTLLMAFGLGCGAFVSGSAAVRGAATAGWQTRGRVRTAVAAVGGLAATVLALTVVSAEQNWASVLALCTVPVVFVLGTRFDEVRPPSLTAVVLTLTASMLLVAGLGTAATSGGATSYSWDDATHGYEMVGPWWQDEAQADRDFVVTDFSSLPPGRASVVINAASPGVLSELREFRLEAWRAEAPRDGWRLLPGQSSPFAVAPVRVDGTRISGEITFTRTPGVEWSQAILTAVDPAGRRVIIAAGVAVQTEFHGSVLDWFAALVG